MKNDGTERLGSIWSSGLLDRQMDHQWWDGQDGILKTVWDVDKVAVWSICTIIRQTLVDCSGLYTYKYEEKKGR